MFVRANLVRGACAIMALTVFALGAPSPIENYDENGDEDLYRWRTRLQYRRQELHKQDKGNKTITVHLVPHAHLDVGWLKTVEECWYGSNASIQQTASVRDIIESVVGFAKNLSVWSIDWVWEWRILVVYIVRVCTIMIQVSSFTGCI